MKKLHTLLMITFLFYGSFSYADCYIMGDSIAQGLAFNRHDCSSETEVGINTKKALKYWLSKGPMIKDKVIISLGVNDGNIDTTDNLMLIRNNIKANQVIWILPPKQDKSLIVRKVATNYGDFVLNINSQIGKDHIHPTGKGYVLIANHIKAFQYENQQNYSLNTSYDSKLYSQSKYHYTSNYVQN
jgi:lysophospholipase L1-like esterase